MKQSTITSSGVWIASRSLSSGAHSRDPLARNDGSVYFGSSFSAAELMQ